MNLHTKVHQLIFLFVAKYDGLAVSLKWSQEISPSYHCHPIFNEVQSLQHGLMLCNKALYLSLLLYSFALKGGHREEVQTPQTVSATKVNLFGK